jgi:hypothetical protein
VKAKRLATMTAAALLGASVAFGVSACGEDREGEVQIEDSGTGTATSGTETATSGTDTAAVGTETAPAGTETAPARTETTP